MMPSRRHPTAIDEIEKEARMANALRRGDRVEWNFGRGKAVGVVKRKLTAPTTIGRQKVAASQDDPRYLVRTDSGKEAAKRPETLRKLGPR
jgi:Hypervirulence associated proteins TUDOR domain